jgi:hypothetical protein
MYRIWVFTFIDVQTNRDLDQGTKIQPIGMRKRIPSPLYMRSFCQGRSLDSENGKWH